MQLFSKEQQRHMKTRFATVFGEDGAAEIVSSCQQLLIAATKLENLVTSLNSDWKAMIEINFDFQDTTAPQPEDEENE